MGDEEFGDFQRLYEHRFNTADKRLDSLEAAMMQHSTKLTTLEVKAGLWGAAAGGVVIAGFVIAKAMGI